MTVRPIIFSAPMVRALLDGRKTQTRRLATSPLRKCEPGDQLYVRETFAWIGFKKGEDLFYRADGEHQNMGTMKESNGNVTEYWTDYWVRNGKQMKGSAWKPGIHMPRWGSRLTLDVGHVDTERLQDIDDHDAMSEGVVMGNDGYWTVPHAPIPRGEEYSFYYARTPRETFAKLWRVLHGDKSWSANPKVVALDFKAHKCNVDQMAKEAA